MNEPTRRPPKRLALLSQLDDLVVAPSGTGVAVPAADRSPTERHRDVSPPGRAPEITRRTSVYLPAATLRRLKEVALARDCKVNDLLVEGAEAVLRDNGHLRSPAIRDTS